MNNYTELYKNILMPILTNHLPKAKIILYGSRARNDHREGADIDIALDAEHAIDLLTMSKIIEDIEGSNLPIPFDIVDFHAVSDSMKKNIIKDGVIWKE